MHKKSLVTAQTDRQYRVVRAAETGDISAIHALLEYYAEMGNLLPRSVDDITANLEYFRVVGEAGDVVGCGALEIFSDTLGEIRSLTVKPEMGGKGIGRLLVTDLIEEARSRKLQRLMALTYSPEFFHRLGFRTVPKDTFPEKVWGICVTCYKFKNCDEIAVLLDLES